MLDLLGSNSTAVYLILFVISVIILQAIFDPPKKKVERVALFDEIIRRKECWALPDPESLDGKSLMERCKRTDNETLKEIPEKNFLFLQSFFVLSFKKQCKEQSLKRSGK